MKYDVIVIGSGPGGYVAAIRASQLGMKTAVVEAGELGGICLNWGCIPTKALLKSAQVYNYMKHAESYGITLDTPAQPDFEAIVRRSRGVAEAMSKGVQFLLKKNNVDVIMGTAKVAPNHQVEVTAADGTKQTLSKSDVIERMREECENRYYVDGADKVTVTLDVQFVLLGDTEEFRQYRNLERVNLYDTIAVDTGHMETRAQVIGYEWDSLMGRYNGVSIGKVYAMARKKIPGYRVANGAISYGKLSAGLIKWIKGADS